MRVLVPYWYTKLHVYTQYMNNQRDHSIHVIHMNVLYTQYMNNQRDHSIHVIHMNVLYTQYMNNQRDHSIHVIHMYILTMVDVECIGGHSRMIR